MRTRIEKRFVQDTRDGVFCELCASYDGHTDDCALTNPTEAA